MYYSCWFFMTTTALLWVYCVSLSLTSQCAQAVEATCQQEQIQAFHGEPLSQTLPSPAKRDPEWINQTSFLLSFLFHFGSPELLGWVLIWSVLSLDCCCLSVRASRPAAVCSNYPQEGGVLRGRGQSKLVEVLWGLLCKLIALFSGTNTFPETKTKKLDCCVKWK